jgi:four helix bundle protein
MTPEELKARTADFAKRVAIAVRPLFARAEARHAVGQLARASSSAAANYRAARLGRSHAEFTAKLGIALEEADEAAFWLEHLTATGIAGGDEFASLTAEARELAAIFGAARRTAQARERGRR